MELTVRIIKAKRYGIEIYKAYVFYDHREIATFESMSQQGVHTLAYRWINKYHGTIIA